MGRLQTEEEADLANVDCKGKVLGGLRPTSLLSSMARCVAGSGMGAQGESEPSES